MISPMYPSKGDPVYGTFIETYYESFKVLNKGNITKLISIKGRSRHKLLQWCKYAFFYIQVLWQLLFHRWDVIYVQTITTPIIPIRVVSFLKELPLIFNVHGADVITHNEYIRRLQRIAESLLSKAIMIVVPSDYFRMVLRNTFPSVPYENIIVSPSGGIDVKKFVPMSRANSELVLGFVSRIDYGKGWELFIEAVEKLNQEGIRTKGIIAGRGAQNESMLRMIKSKNLHDIIEYVGPVAHDNLPKIFNKFTLFCFPTTSSESLGLVGIEALACGVPIIGSNIGGLPGFVYNGKNGFLFEPGNLDDFISKIHRFLKMSNNEKDKMRKEARRIALSYDTDMVMKELYETINRFITTRN